MDVREKLLEAAEVLNHYRNRHYNESGATEEYKLAQAINDVLPTLAQVIANGVTVQEWISVKNRLPEADKQILVCTASGSVKTARCNFYENGTKVIWATNDGLGERAITHWMPLPQPPKGE